MAEARAGSNWWRDHLVGLITTIIGGVVAALIVAVLIPALASDDTAGTDNPADAPTEQEAPPEGGDDVEEPATEGEPSEGG